MMFGKKFPVCSPALKGRSQEKKTKKGNYLDTNCFPWSVYKLHTLLASGKVLNFPALPHSACTLGEPCVPAHWCRLWQQSSSITSEVLSFSSVGGVGACLECCPALQVLHRNSAWMWIQPQLQH